MNNDTSISEGSRVSMHFSLAIAGNEPVISTFGESPVEFALGDGTLDPGLEDYLLERCAGDMFTLHLPPGQAYGERDPERVQQIALSDFPPDMEPREDLLMSFALPSGEVIAGHILEIGEGYAEVDFNHPLAGQPVEFRVEILKVTEAQ